MSLRYLIFFEKNTQTQMFTKKIMLNIQYISTPFSCQNVFFSIKNLCEKSANITFLFISWSEWKRRYISDKKNQNHRTNKFASLPITNYVAIGASENGRRTEI